ncbi:hypothetical protein [Paraburkholderia sp. BL10I2N1]|uniref:hypothetical protein n=1 Tax=Paraburkholderia sp. BL10I2N1 TaxID=1938796 RepID=UPI00105D97E4|nr:hypothetical protein [Paraburkholderia sp. BL10I2N1]
MKDAIMRWRLSPAAYVVWVALGDPAQWDFDSEYTIAHRNGTRFRVSAGAGGFRPEGAVVGLNFGFFERRILWAQYQKALHLTLISKMLRM